ncbi:MAG: hypothetical protein EOP40_07275 [Rubrivivax sp.]|nr:MAG: hypothetical protein EOP40_07275 [Rubrivivax sp.]
MRFWQHQAQARLQTARLLVWFAVLVTMLAGVVNALLALIYKLVMPFSHGWPALFFETNTALVLLFVLGGCWVESMRLRDGGGTRVAHWMGGVMVLDSDDDVLRRRLLNVVDEMALASAQPVPQVFVLPREQAINAFVAGWSAQDAALCVTQGALDRLTRAELQGLVAHEFGHLAEGDGRLAMRMLALVWGLSLVHGWGRALMSTDEHGRALPMPWLMGGALAAAGWLGWLAGRMLQAAVSRQREFLADARAIQFTRARDGLGQVLRKVLHEQITHTSRLNHPQADALSFMWLHTPGWASWLTLHPPLAERIRRIYGISRPALATPGEPESGHARLEPRHVALSAVDSGPGGLGPPVDGLRGSQPSAAWAAVSRPGPLAPMGPPRLLTDPDTANALGRLQRLSGPLQQRMAILAFMMTPENQAEQRFWQRSVRDLHGAAQILADVQRLPPNWRVPEFERLVGLMAYEPVEQRRALVVATRELLRADGKVSARDRLWWLVLRHRMGEINVARAIMRPVTGQGRDLSQLSSDECAHVAQFSAYMGRLLPDDTTSSQPGPTGLAWYRGVMARCVPPGAPLPMCRPPDADELMHALAGTQELSWMIRPQLVRAWVEEALNHSPEGVMSVPTADALRLAAGLLDTPLPPALASQYPRP